MKAKRAPGVIVTESVEPTWRLTEEEEKTLKQKQEEREARAERREQRYNNAPNHITYRDIVFFVGVNIDEDGNWIGKGKIPPCVKCHGLLHPGEHHNCPGFRARYRTDRLSREERKAMREGSWLENGDWDDDQYDPTTPDETTRNLRMRHEAETGETYDQVVIEGMTEDEYLMQKFGYIPNFEDFEED